jgi:putative DNA primase/helicase
MSDIAKNVIHFPSSLIHEDIAHWESKTPPKDEAAAHLLKMADHFARRLEKEPAARDEVVQSLDRVRKAHDIKRAGADILSTALENLRSSKPVANYSGPLLQSAPASSFRMKRIRWAWPNRIAIGELALIVGMPDEGKGQILYYSAATVTRGGEWPCGEGRAPKGRVLLLTAEDNIHSVVVPRLLAAGADLDQVEVIQMVEADGSKRMFSLVTDLPLLRQKIEHLGDVKLVLVDPIASYLSGGAGKKDYRGNTVDVRSVLDPLVDMAAELNVAIMGVMHFNKKQDVTNVMLRTSDSLAFTAIARQVYGAIDDPENGRKLFVKGKNNIADRAYSDKTLAYRFASKKVGTDEETGEDIIAPFIVWDDDHVDITADEAMSATKSPAARDEAKKFLADMLADGPVLANDVKDAASGNGISERTLKRAKQELGVQADKDGSTGKWSWHLPGKSKSPTKH